MLRQTELVHRAHFCVDNAKDEIDAEALAHHARAIPGEIIRIGEVASPRSFNCVFWDSKKAIRERERLVRGQTWRIGPDRFAGSRVTARSAARLHRDEHPTPRRFARR